MRHLTLTAFAAALLAGTPALAQPPAGSKPLSEIIAAVEAGDDVAWIESVDWDDDGYWEVEYRRPDSRRSVDIRVDPVSGQRL